jgi:hypothetical protein
MQVICDLQTTFWSFAVFAAGNSPAASDTYRWLLTLVWPEHEDRRARQVEGPHQGGNSSRPDTSR